MTDKKLLRTGIAGAGLAALCCFTPVLVVLLGVAGLGAIVGWLDYGLFPLLFASLGLVAYALYLRSDRRGPAPTIPIVGLVVVLSALLIWLEFRYALRIAVAATLVTVAYGYYLRPRRDGREAPS